MRDSVAMPLLWVKRALKRMLLAMVKTVSCIESTWLAACARRINQLINQT